MKVAIFQDVHLAGGDLHLDAVAPCAVGYGVEYGPEPKPIRRVEAPGLPWRALARSARPIAVRRSRRQCAVMRRAMIAG